MSPSIAEQFDLARVDRRRVRPNREQIRLIDFGLAAAGLIFALGDRADDYVVEQAVAGHDTAAVECERARVHVGDAAAGLFDDQGARGDVPRLEAEFPKAVGTSTGDPGKIERGAAI